MSASCPMDAHVATAQIVVAACTGTGRVSRKSGLPVFHIDAALDAGSAIASLNALWHGCAVRWTDSFQAFDIEKGWNDWAPVPVDVAVIEGVVAPADISVIDGRILVPLPDGATIGEFRCQLAGALRHLRLQDVTIRADYLEARAEAMGDVLIHPRYTPDRAAEWDCSGARLVTDLYALDLAADGWRLLWLVAAARLAATDGRRPRWR